MENRKWKKGTAGAGLGAGFLRFFSKFVMFFWGKVRDSSKIVRFGVGKVRFFSKIVMFVSPPFFAIRPFPDNTKDTKDHEEEICDFCWKSINILLAGVRFCRKSIHIGLGFCGFSCKSINIRRHRARGGEGGGGDLVGVREGCGRLVGDGIGAGWHGISPLGDYTEHRLNIQRKISGLVRGRPRAAAGGSGGD